MFESLVKWWQEYRRKAEVQRKQDRCRHDGSRWSSFKSWEGLDKLARGQITLEEYRVYPTKRDEHGCDQCGKIWYS